MSSITPENFLAKVSEWHDLVGSLSVVKEREMALRKELDEYAFPDAKEGTSRVDLPANWKLKGEHKLTRKVDETALPPILSKLREEFQVDTDKLIKFKPELSVSVYKKLSKEARLLIDQALEIKPGTPSLTLEPPKGSK